MKFYSLLTTIMICGLSILSTGQTLVESTALRNGNYKLRCYNNTTSDIQVYWRHHPDNGSNDILNPGNYSTRDCNFTGAYGENDIELNGLGSYIESDSTITTSRLLETYYLEIRNPNASYSTLAFIDLCLGNATKTTTSNHFIWTWTQTVASTGPGGTLVLNTLVVKHYAPRYLGGVAYFEVRYS